jgi:hypothetical protein
MFKGVKVIIYNSHKASVRYIHELKKPKYISKLKSVVNLKNNKLQLK